MLALKNARTQQSSAYPIIITDVMNKAAGLTCPLIDEWDLKASRSTTTKIPRDVRRDNERPAGEIMVEAALTVNEGHLLKRDVV